MLKNYFKLAFRNLLRNKWVSLINIFGLAIAISTCIVVFLYVQNEAILDDFHENGDRIFMLEYEVDYNGESQIWGNVPMPLGKVLINDFPQIEQMARFDTWGGGVYLEDQIFDESVYFADPSYFDLFTFPLEQGTPQVLNEPNTIIISSELSKKYFQEENAIDKVLTIVFGNQEKRNFTIKGIAAPFPNNTGFKFDIISGMNTYTSISTADINDWSNHTAGTFVQLKNVADVELIAAKLDKYVSIQNQANKDLKIKSFVFDNLMNPNPKAHEIKSRPVYTPHPVLTLLFVLIAPLMLLLSCFNYINISLGIAGKRLKEIGIRKVSGARKSQLIGQFLSENLLLCFLALLFGLFITKLISIPLFNSVLALPISLSLIDTPNLWMFLTGLLALIAIASGAYPAFYISSFEPTAIFKGSQKLIKENKLARLFLGVQFILTFSTIIIGVLLSSAGDYWKNLDWGYHPDETFMVRLDNAKQYNILKNEVEKSPYIKKVGGSVHHIGESMSNGQIKIGEQETKIVQFQVGPGYFEALGLQISQGRSFDINRSTEDAQGVVINQTFADQQGWKDPLSKTFRLGGQQYHVIGVVADFKMDMYSKKLPVAIFLGKQEAYGYMAIRHVAGKNEQVETFVKQKWTNLYSDIPFHFFHQKLVFKELFKHAEKASNLVGYIAGLALLIACIGLFGLATQNYDRFLKEATIRKVLGASVTQVVFLANKKFTIMLVVASIIATIICWVGMQMLLMGIKEYIGELQLGFTPFLVANLLVFITAFIAVSGQSYKLTKITPADALRIE